MSKKKNKTPLSPVDIPTNLVLCTILSRDRTEKESFMWKKAENKQTHTEILMDSPHIAACSLEPVYPEKYTAKGLFSVLYLKALVKFLEQYRVDCVELSLNNNAPLQAKFIADVNLKYEELYISIAPRVEEEVEKDE